MAKKKVKVSKSETYKQYIYKGLKQAHTDTGNSLKAMSRKVATEPSKLSRYNKKAHCHVSRGPEGGAAGPAVRAAQTRVRGKPKAVTSGSPRRVTKSAMMRSSANRSIRYPNLYCAGVFQHHRIDVLYKFRDFQNMLYLYLLDLRTSWDLKT
ncbi:hypothetical protein VOLCADRAFT_104307 [Volvox carteri f. nagariensis]|uniref:Uncharacterized protein n=1 Tax=Volvox carteri f. nagariensis TaxID=3068 RepID=D8TSQ4_VOLCA|nr:uncharacterized protein VOLCADRAFT_104307 [Volvox carteri f. nagariensis]EFJ49528.1 hypothetical protein VOLCADRAFT_104307 [Volvox carteri f. nagariensis]|eukprot:XP_002949509.1 hypothetical protein VOLCADRAFT_104307 [Volvox carteri f. nagariensis]